MIIINYNTYKFKLYIMFLVQGGKILISDMGIGALISDMGMSPEQEYYLKIILHHVYFCHRF